MSRPRTVVVCDDQIDVREALVDLLGDLKHLAVVGAAKDGPDCLEVVSRCRPDLLVLDLNMPGGGPHIARRSKDLHPDLRVIVYTGSGAANVERDARAPRRRRLRRQDRSYPTPRPSHKQHSGHSRKRLNGRQRSCNLDYVRRCDSIG